MHNCVKGAYNIVHEQGRMIFEKHIEKFLKIIEHKALMGSGCEYFEKRLPMKSHVPLGEHFLCFHSPVNVPMNLFSREISVESEHLSANQR